MTTAGCGALEASDDLEGEATPVGARPAAAPGVPEPEVLVDGFEEHPPSRATPARSTPTTASRVFI
jgi:hypothetical protein